MLNVSTPLAFVSPDAISPIDALPAPIVAYGLAVLSVACTSVASSHWFDTFTTICTMSVGCGRPLTAPSTVKLATASSDCGACTTFDASGTPRPSPTALTLRAVCSSCSRTSAMLQLGRCDRSNPASPATNGAARLVPEPDP